MSEELLNSIKKKYGNIFVSGQHLVDNPKKIIPVSPAVDIILGGGIPQGSFCIFSGHEKSGKTTTALHFCGNAQQAGMKIFYENIEGRIKSRDLKGIKTLNPSEVELIESYPGKIITAEEYLRVGEEILKGMTNVVLIMDSVSALCTEKEYTSDIGETGRNPIHLMLGTFCRKISNILPINNNILICIVHMISNTSGYGSPFSESGGKKIKYQVDINMRIKKHEKWIIGKEGSEPIGQILNWETSSTAIAPPGRTCQSYLRYGHGLDEQAEIAALGINFGFIEKSASWFNMAFMGEKAQKVQGQEAVTNFLRENKEAFELLKQKIKEMLGV